MNEENEIKNRTLSENKIYSKKEPLKSRQESILYKQEYEFTDKDNSFNSPKLYIDFYAGKKDNIRKIPIHTIEIK